ncbi:MAG: adenylate/guanylate cyclase domain-containing protein [Fimbriimonadaceae bacterium]|nr:adenylate/guanylate cyclase domain-containing protein [Fimbriimonadaceae bacterium]
MHPLLRAYLVNLAISVGFATSSALVVPQMRGVPLWFTVPLFAVPFSILMFIAATWVRPKMRHRSFVVTVLGQALLYMVVIAASFSVSLWVFIAHLNDVSPFDPGYLRQFGQVLVSGAVLGPAAACFVFAVTIGGIYQISRKMGPGVLWNWVTGRYHEPSEEPRFFMFLDLKDSTTLAEQLGNKKFSALVRDFFEDLTDPVVKTRGEVSHFIGDEAVLTWRMDRGAARANAARCFFLMRDALEARRAHYLRCYGHFPGFKAGLHCGPVVATEVGEIKSEIVFHGDVLNTTARITGVCAALGEDFLASDAARLALAPQETLAFECLGPQMFKGKSESVVIHAVRVRAPAADSKPGKQESARENL